MLSGFEEIPPKLVDQYAGGPGSRVSGERTSLRQTFGRGDGRIDSGHSEFRHTTFSYLCGLSSRAGDAWSFHAGDQCWSPLLRWVAPSTPLLRAEFPLRILGRSHHQHRIPRLEQSHRDGQLTHQSAQASRAAIEVGWRRRSGD